ncbi:MAG: sigma 54-interacting transcriptional regulator, partial [Thermodesulfobacteriota bacterium]
MPSRTGTEQLELKALYEIAQLIGSALDLERALAAILGILHDTLRMERATLVLLEEGGRRLAIRASHGLTDQEASRGVYGLDEGVIGKVFRTAEPFVVPDISREPLFLNRTGARTLLPKGEISFLGVPVLLRQEPVGVLTVDRLFGAEVSFSEDIRFLTVVATLIAQFLNLHQAISSRHERLVEENATLKAELADRFQGSRIIGQSKIMEEVFRTIAKVAASAATVLILGESGTGKELVARAIHTGSPRRHGPFIKVNCAALPETLLESELLGHEKGAFTGAVAPKKGRFELADGGTLFLDEVGELPLALQAKLLRVLQERQFERLGGTRTIEVDVRIIAATNQDLHQAAAEGRFRGDLYYRLHVVPVILPPLRERRQDIPLLIEHFLARSNQRNHRHVTLSREALELLVSHPWPGNVRELENVIE